MEQLLEERERDLELAARIGQTLLEKNRQLIEQVTFFLNSLETNYFLKVTIKSLNIMLKYMFIKRILDLELQSNPIFFIIMNTVRNPIRFHVKL